MIIHDHATIALQVVAMTTILRLGHAHIVPMATETGTAIMKCTKVPGTLARTYANEHVCIFN